MNDDLLEAFNKLGSCCGWSAEELSTALVKFSQSLNGPQTSDQIVKPNQKTDLEIFERNGGEEGKVKIYLIEKIENI